MMHHKIEHSPKKKEQLVGPKLGQKANEFIYFQDKMNIDHEDDHDSYKLSMANIGPGIIFINVLLKFCIKSDRRFR